MKQLSLAALLVLVALPAAASPPPLPVAVTPLVMPAASDGLLDDGHALRTRLIADGWFSDQASTLERASLEACADDADPEPCIRALTAPTRGKTAPEVVVVLTPEAGKVRLRCFGPAETTRNAAKQSVLVSLAAALDATPGQGGDARATAAGCLISAAAESGW